MTDDPRARLKRMLNPDNFLGSGLTLQEWSLSGMIDRWQNCLSNLSDREATRRRVSSIRRICVAIDAIERAHGVFNVRGLERGLVAVINGEWQEVRSIADELLYRGEDASFRAEWTVAHAPIRALLLEACNEAALLDSSASDATRH